MAAAVVTVAALVMRFWKIDHPAQVVYVSLPFAPHSYIPWSNPR